MKKELKMKNNLMEKVVNLCKRRGFIFPTSEIYGGTGSVWDYGPVGVLFKNNVKQAWWQDMVQMRDDMIPQDASILMNPKVWEASGHVSGFHDPLVECGKCHRRYREDHLAEGRYGEVNIRDGKAICPDKKCSGQLMEAKQFNLMFKTFMGPVEESASVTYLRPETAQGIFVNFKHILEVSRKKLPFGIAQIGKAFRNEITPGNFTFRTREFEQMEIEYFVMGSQDKVNTQSSQLKTKDADFYYKYWIDERFDWYQKYGIKKDNLRTRKHDQDELAHYAKSATDIEYKFPFGWSELEGIANRGDYDLVQHEKVSGKDMKYFDEEKKEKYFPSVIEPSAGADRATLAFLVDAYDENEKGEVFLRLHPKLAPYKVAILPLVKNKPEITEIARNIYDEFKQFWFVVYDEVSSIGRRYRRQDEIGTPYCVTVDFDSVKDNTVTVRDRDTMKQERMKIEDIREFIHKQIK
jgi:glycyl-tRNA synthetase